VADKVYRTSVTISKQHKRHQNADHKAERLTDLPSVDDFVRWLEHDLCEKFEAEIRRWRAEGFDEKMYIAGRDFFLVMLMCAVPPQRLQLLQLMSLRDMKPSSTGSVYFKIREHKTGHIYGQAVMFIPKRFVKLFTKFRVFRRELLRHQVSALKMPELIDEERVFFRTDGKPDNYLTARFKQLVFEKFGKKVTIRDCRSIYITYANQHVADLKDMFELSRLMYHSFATQQQVYRSDTVLHRLHNGEQLAERIATLQTSATIESEAALPILQMDVSEAIQLEEEDADFLRDQDGYAGEFSDLPDDDLLVAALDQAEAGMADIE